MTPAPRVRSRAEGCGRAGGVRAFRPQQGGRNGRPHGRRTRPSASAAVLEPGYVRDQERAALALARGQDDVLTAAQARGVGLDQGVLDRRVAEGRWRRLHRGVVVVHAGPPPWRTLARAALLHAGPEAALSHRAAGWLQGLAPQPNVIDVTIPHHRRIRPSEGVVVHRHRGPLAVGGSLPMTALVVTVADLLAMAPDADETVRLVAAAVDRGLPAEHLRRVLAARRTQPGRRLALEMLAEVAVGTESALELRYHRDVERAHGLPRSRAQAWDRLGSGLVRADRRYDQWATRVELDGSLAHRGSRGDADVWRDNAVALEIGDLTLRYRWRHVLSPCRTATQVAAALRARGWSGVLRACGPGCPAIDPPRGL